jgi:hypothetical protein
MSLLGLGVHMIAPAAPLLPTGLSFICALSPAGLIIQHKRSGGFAATGSSPLLLPD